MTCPEDTTPTGNDEPEKRKATWRTKLVALTLSAVFTLLLVEVAARFITSGENRPKHDQQDQTIAAYDPQLGWSWEPNVHTRHRSSDFDVAIRINSRGVRSDREYSEQPPPGIARIVALGDSFTFGHGVESADTYCQVLENDLPNTEVINLAVSGFGTDQQLLMLRKEGFKYQPDLVILGLYLGDVFRNALHYRNRPKPYFVLRDSELVLANVPVPTELPTRPWTTQLLNRSRLYSLASKRTVRLAQHYGFGASWRLTEKIVEAMAAEVRSQGAELLVVVIGAETRVYGSGLKKHAHVVAIEHLVELLQRIDVEYIDTTPRFVEVAASGGDRLYYAHDGHFTPAGHALTARLIEEHLTAGNWRPTDGHSHEVPRSDKAATKYGLQLDVH